MRSTIKMFMTKESVLILVFGFFLVQCKLNPEEMVQFEKECVEKVKIDYNIIKEVRRTMTVSDDVKYKQFLNCYYEKQGYKGENGEINFNKIKEMLMDADADYTSSDMDAVLRPCKKLNPIHPEDLSVLLLKCILHNLLELESKN